MRAPVVLWFATVVLGLGAPSLTRADVAKGVRIGANLFSLQNDRDSGSGPSQGVIAQPGFTAGAFVTWRLAPAFALQPEVHVSRKGVRIEECSPCVDKASIELWYLELPFLLRLDLLPGVRSKLHLDFGPELVIALGGGETDPMTGADEVYTDLKTGNLGGVVGAGVELGAGPGRIAIDFRFTRWITPLTEAANSNHKSSSNQYAISLGYVFP